MPYSVTTEKSWARILDDLETSFDKWDGVARGWRAETILAPRSSSKQTQTLEERTVTLRWARRGKAYEITMANQRRAVDNLLVLWLIIEALRLNEARGFAAQVAEVYRQEFPALPGPGQTNAAGSEKPDPMSSTGPYALLYVVRMAPLAVCEAAYRELSKRYHPDVTGSTAVQQSLNAAIEQIRKEQA